MQKMTHGIFLDEVIATGNLKIDLNYFVCKIWFLGSWVKCVQNVAL